MDKSGRVVGMLVFVLGVVLLLLVLLMAYIMFTSPASEFLPRDPATGSPLPASSLAAAIISTLVKIALLFVMTLAASLIASRGIHLYLGSSERK